MTLPPAPAAPPPRKKTGLYVLIGVAALVLLLAIGGLIAIWQLGLLPFLGGGLASPEIMPQSVGLYGTMRIDIQTTSGYKHLYDIYGQMPELQESLDEALAEITEESGVSFEQDVRPWLGNEVALGITDIAALSGASALLSPYGYDASEPGYIVAIATRDANASEAFLGKVRGGLEEQGYTVERKEIGGVPFYVREAQSEYDTATLFGTLKGFVILSSSEKAVQDMVDVSQGRAESLAKSAQYQEVMAALPGNAAGYFVLPDIKPLVEEGAGISPIGLPGTAAEQLEAYKGAGVAIILGEEGIQLDVVVTFDPSALSAEALAGMQAARGQDRLVERVPADALGFISAYDLAGGWSNLITSLKASPDVADMLEGISMELGLSVDEELLSWADGEYVVAVVEAYGVIPDFSIGGFVLMEVSDRAQAEETLGKIGTALQELAGVGFEPGTVGGVEMQLLSDPYSGQNILGYGFDAQGNLLIGFTEEALRDGLGQDIRPITADEYFSRVQAYLPKGGGYFYVNIERTWQLLYDSMSEYEQEDFGRSTQPYLEPIKAAGWAGHPVDTGKGINRMTLFIYIP